MTFQTVFDMEDQAFLVPDPKLKSQPAQGR
jgi:hypothetical protein